MSIQKKFATTCISNVLTQTAQQTKEILFPKISYLLLGQINKRLETKKKKKKELLEREEAPRPKG